MLCSASRLFVLVDIRASCQPESHCPGRPVVAFEKGPEVIAKPPVPFLPAVADEAADLIKAGGVPGSAISLTLASENRIRFDIPKDRRRCHWLALLVA
jgi:hypothetical protein